MFFYYRIVLAIVIKTYLLASILLFSFSHAEMVFHRGNCTEPQSLDPQISGDVQSSHILRDLFEGLIAEDIYGELTPGVATHWTVSLDGLVYTFYLRDAQWSNGQPITAHDFVYAWRRALKPETGNSYAFLLYPVKNAEAIATGKETDITQLGIVALEDNVLQVTLHTPTPYFLSLLTHSISYPAPQNTIETYGTAWTKPEHIVSNGAFVMTDWIPQAYLTLTKSDTYWDKDKVRLDKVIYYLTEDRGAELRRFRAGEIDWTCSIPNEQLDFIKTHLADSFMTSNRLGVYYYGFNTTKAPFKDNPALRKALALAINRQLLVEKVMGTGEQVAYNLVMDGVLNAKPYVPDYASWTQAQRETLAKQLYRTAGYSDDTPLRFEIRYNTSENHKKIAIAVAGMWAKVLGVKTTLVNEEWKVFLQNRSMKHTEVFRADWVGDYNDANTFLALFSSHSGKNDVGYLSPAFDTLLQQASKAQIPEKRAQLLHDAEKQLIDDVVLIPLYFYVNKHLIHPRVRGYHLNVMNHSRSKTLWIEE